MEFAWNVQKNKMSDVKGKEMEQDRKGKIRNDDIKLNKTYLNYDLVNDHRSLYNRVKDRVNEVKDNSRIRKDSVVMCSNVVTVNKETATRWGSDKVERYFKETYNYFCNEFGKENVVSAKVHLDETTPHMHLHFVPISEEGKLQCKKILTRNRINKVHTNAPKFLQEKGFNVERGSGETGKKNIKDIHKFKSQDLENKVIEKQQELNRLIETINNLKYSSNSIDNDKLSFDINDIKIENLLLDKSKIKIDKLLFYNLIDNYQLIFNKNIDLSKENVDLKSKNKTIMKENNDLKEINSSYKKRYEYIDDYYAYKEKLDKEYNEKVEALSKKYEYHDARVDLLRRDLNSYKRERDSYRNRVESLQKEIHEMKFGKSKTKSITKSHSIEMEL